MKTRINNIKQQAVGHFGKTSQSLPLVQELSETELESISGGPMAIVRKEG